ncbi:AraC family transcriptional regulator [Aliiruegeria lutimaris]|uniref:Transcriptional regulator, AraC family n=1 Tax=Aliiruegeria lutimaris TaxID=571298 RepID=A0A1G8PRI0_9RHOB|nr:AraC family transcriptional regulator [Aliiruegeria lutimaris]SDI95091.1 transcriptional regulator, AraC family [Aliiruegeria lutimaris]
MGTVTSLFLHKMVAAAGADVDQAGLLRSVGLDPAGAADPKVMIEDTEYYALLERIAAEIDVTDLPLRTGASMRLDDYGALGLAFKTATTLDGSYRRITRYARLWTSVVEYSLEPEGENTWFHLHRAGPRRLGLRLSNEATLASATAIAREVSATGSFFPLEVHVRHAAPRSTAPHEVYFGCPVVFGSDRDALLIARDAMASANRLGDGGIARFLEQHLEQELSEVTDRQSVAERARDVIADALSEGLPRMEEVAGRLGLSARSLHRRLAEEGLSFKLLTDDTRRDLAQGLLHDQQYSIAEIAYLTGFSEQSAFNRAFKRWTGATPAGYRNGRSLSRS